jgi:hypothetical protein
MAQLTFSMQIAYLPFYIHDFIQIKKYFQL